MAFYKCGGGGKSDLKIINGILKEYYAINEEISANNFAKYVETALYMNETVGCSISNYTNSMHATLIGSDIVLLTYAYSTSNYFAKAIAIKFDIVNKTYTYGTEVVISTYAYSGFGSAVKVDDNTIIYCFCAGNGIGYSTIIVDNNLTISASSQITYENHTLSSNAYTSGYTTPHCATLTNNQDILFAVTNYSRSGGFSLFSIDYINGTTTLINNYKWDYTAIPLGLFHMSDDIFIVPLLYNNPIQAALAFRYENGRIIESGVLTTFRYGCSELSSHYARAIKYDSNTIVYVLAYSTQYKPMITIVNLNELVLTSLSSQLISEISSSTDVYTSYYTLAKVGNSIFIEFAGEANGYGKLYQVNISDDYALSKGELWADLSNYYFTKSTITEINQGVFITEGINNSQKSIKGKLYTNGVYPLSYDNGNVCIVAKDCKLDEKGKVYIPMK